MVEDFSRIKHHFGKRRELGAVMPRIHTAITMRPSGSRVFQRRVAGNEEVDFFAGEFPGITFFADQVDSAHAFEKANGERNTRFGGRQRAALPTPISKIATAPAARRRQIGGLAENYVPAPRRVDVHMRNAELTAEALAIDDRPGRPEAGCYAVS